MLKTALCAIAFALSATIEVPVWAQLPENVKLPEGWGELAAPAASGCPQLEGVYEREGARVFIETTDGKAIVDRAPSGSLIWLGHPRLRGRASRPTRPIEPGHPPRADTFAIGGNPPAAFEVTTVNRDRTALEVTPFEPSRGDFACAGGIVRLPLEDTQGFRYSDGVASDVQAQSGIARAADGSIIYIRAVRSKARSLLLDLGTRERLEYYRFPPAAR